MESDREVRQSDVEKLIDDANYLIDEAEALKYVIDAVPFDETPPGGKSIIDMLRLINFAQKEYYRPVTEKVFSENRILRLTDFDHFEEAFEAADDPGDIDIQKVLSGIIKQRAALINVFKKISLIDWERMLRNQSGNEISLLEFANDMVKEERATLKQIADLVLIYQNELQYQREINKKAGQQQ